MTDIDALITAELERLVPIVGEPDWGAVARAAGLRSTRRRARFLAVAFAAAAVAVVLATPLGAEIARGLGGFSQWLTGEPGTPASKRAQEQFATANARSWLGFPKGTHLRHLIATRAEGVRVELYGFRSGTSVFCLRLVVIGKTQAGTVECAPLADLRRRDAPVRVLLGDQPIGRGAKTAWYGLDRIHSAHLQITAGIADDTVRDVVLQDEQGRHRVPVVANAFLYVATNPDVGQRVRRVWARTSAGLVSVPYVPTPFGFGGGPARSGGAPAVVVERPALNGRIHWLDQHGLRGEPLAVLPSRVRAFLLGYRGGGVRSRILYGRVLTPDPSRPLRIVLTLNAHRHGGPPAGLCVETVSRNGAGGGCMPYPQGFAASPFNFSVSGGGAGQFVEASGAVSDAAVKLRAVLADRQSLPVSLKDNTFAVDLPAAQLPARLVAYDAQGRSVGVTGPIQGFGGGGAPAPSVGRATQLLAVSGPSGAHAELLVGRAAGGGECVYVKHFISKREAGTSITCHGARWQGQPLQLYTISPFFIAGSVRPDVARVRVEFAAGRSMLLHPTRGYVLALVDAAHRADGAQPRRFVGVNANGRTVGVQRMPAPRKAATR